MPTDREVLAPAPHQPQADRLEELEARRRRARRRRPAKSVECLKIERLPDQPHRPGVLEVEAELLGHRVQQRQVPARRPSAGASWAAEELADADRPGATSSTPADAALDRQEPQDEGVAQGRPRSTSGASSAGPAAERLADHEVAAAQAAPGLAGRGRRRGSRCAQLGLVRRGRSRARARPQARRSQSKCDHGLSTVGDYAATTTGSSSLRSSRRTSRDVSATRVLATITAPTTRTQVRKSTNCAPGR